tara:strand:- start:3170 stop:4771 length:1602 start_codon:yes stop_codon:yes gene_type:complete
MQRRNIILFIIILKSLLGFPISLYSQATISKIDSIYLISKNNSDDILKNEALSEYVKYYYRTKDWEQFHKYRKEQLKLALKIKDSASYAKVLEFSGAYFMNQNIPDSAYYFYNKSFQIYDFLCDSLSAGKALLNNAIIQKNVSDYVGSEATSFKALHYLLSTKNERRISSVYNNLGIVYNQLGDFDNAVKYHQLALGLRKNISDSQIYALHSLNNIGKVYADKKDYDRAIEYYEQIFNSTSLLQINRIFYAVVLDNYTYAGFKNGKLTNIEDSFKEALSIREEAEETNGIIINCIHLAEYYKQKGNYPLALEYAKRAEKLSDSIRNYRDFLASLELMSSIYETNEAKTIFTKYIRIRDSLDRQTRNFKDQFARIRFETEEKENLIQNQQKNILNQEGEIKKRQTIIASFIVITLLVIILIIGIIIHRKRKQKQLEQELMKGFEPYLKGKYNLSNHNIEFWKLWITGIDQKSLSKKLFITVNSVKSRRKSLREKIEKVIPIEGKFDKPKAILLYNKELDFYKENRGNFSPDYQN